MLYTYKCICTYQENEREKSEKAKKGKVRLDEILNVLLIPFWTAYIALVKIALNRSRVVRVMGKVEWFPTIAAKFTWQITIGATIQFGIAGNFAFQENEKRNQPQEISQEWLEMGARSYQYFWRCNCCLTVLQQRRLPHRP